MRPATPTGANAVRRASLAARAAVAGAALVLAGCSGGDAAEAPDSPDAPAGATFEADSGLPSEHVHAVAADPGDGTVLLATHDGLVTVADGAIERVGPSLDLMGFTVAGPGHYYASGHPGPGSDLPQPLGLVESTDGGASWQPVSRGGESDFHTLAAAGDGLVGFDGVLRATQDGKAWRELQVPEAPFDLSASPSGQRLVATTPDGPLLSTDAGTTWDRPEGAPVVAFAAWADEDRLVAVEPGGGVTTSSDAGRTWSPSGSLGAQPEALWAGGDRVLAVAGGQLLESTDGGAAFGVLPT